VEDVREEGALLLLWRLIKLCHQGRKGRGRRGLPTSLWSDRRHGSCMLSIPMTVPSPDNQNPNNTCNAEQVAVSPPMTRTLVNAKTHHENCFEMFALSQITPRHHKNQVIKISYQTSFDNEIHKACRFCTVQ
jgi:hypothetical protein